MRMHPLDWLHGVTLACCLALGVGLWHISRRPAQEPAAPAQQVREDPRAAETVRALERQVESLRVRLEECETARAPLAAAPAPPTGAVVKAFDDPAVQARLREAVRGARRELRSLDYGGLGFAGPIDGSFLFSRRGALMGLGLNDAQKGALEALLKGSLERISVIAEEARKDAKTREQANAEIARERAQTDAQAAALLTAEQAAKYSESRKPRGSMFRSGTDGKSRGGSVDGLGHLVEIKEPSKIPKQSGMQVFEMEMQESPELIMEGGEAPPAP